MLMNVLFCCCFFLSLTVFFYLFFFGRHFLLHRHTGSQSKCSPLVSTNRSAAIHTCVYICIIITGLLRGTTKNNHVCLSRTWLVKRYVIRTPGVQILTMPRPSRSQESKTGFLNDLKYSRLTTATMWKRYRSPSLLVDRCRRGPHLPVSIRNFSRLFWNACSEGCINP